MRVIERRERLSALIQRHTTAKTQPTIEDVAEAMGDKRVDMRLLVLAASIGTPLPLLIQALDREATP